MVDEVEPRIRELLQAWPTIPATVIAERIGWTRSIRVLSGRVAELRPAFETAQREWLLSTDFARTVNVLKGGRTIATMKGFVSK